MPITTDNSHPEIRRTAITVPSGSHAHVGASITTTVADSHNSSVMAFNVEGNGVVDPTRADFARGGVLRTGTEYGKEVRSVTFDPDHAGPVLARLGLPNDMQASVSIHYHAGNHSAGITIISAETGARAVNFTPAHAEAMLKSLAVQHISANSVSSSVLPELIKKEVLAHHPEIVVQASRTRDVKAVNIEADAINIEGARGSMAISHNRASGGLHINLHPVDATSTVNGMTATRDRIVQHLRAHGIQATLTNDPVAELGVRTVRGSIPDSATLGVEAALVLGFGGLDLPKGVTCEQAMTALAKPAMVSIGQGDETVHSTQAPVITREVAAHAISMIENICPASTAFSAVTRVAGVTARALGPISALKDIVGYAANKSDAERMLASMIGKDGMPALSPDAITEYGHIVAGSRLEQGATFGQSQSMGFNKFIDWAVKNTMPLDSLHKLNPTDYPHPMVQFAIASRRDVTPQTDTLKPGMEHALEQARKAVPSTQIQVAQATDGGRAAQVPNAQPQTRGNTVA